MTNSFEQEKKNDIIVNEIIAKVKLLIILKQLSAQTHQSLCSTELTTYILMMIYFNNKIKLPTRYIEKRNIDIKIQK